MTPEQISIGHFLKNLQITNLRYVAYVKNKNNILVAHEI